MHENRKYLSVPLDTLIDSVEFCESLVGKVFPACSKLQIGEFEYILNRTDFVTGIGQFHFEAVVCLLCNSPFRRQPHPGPREALPRPVHALPEHDPDALEVGRREDADPVADDPAGEPRSGTGHGGHPTVPLRTGPRQAAAHLGILGKRLTSPKSDIC